MGYHDHDIKEKFLTIGNKGSIAEIPEELVSKVMSVAGRLDSDVEENKKILREAREYFVKAKEKFDCKELIIEKLMFIDNYLKTDVSFIEDDIDSNIPTSFLESLYPHAKNKIIKVDFPFNFLQLKTIVFAYHQTTGKLTFPISKGFVSDGKIIGVLRGAIKSRFLLLLHIKLLVERILSLHHFCLEKVHIEKVQEKTFRVISICTDLLIKMINPILCLVIVN